MRIPYVPISALLAVVLVSAVFVYSRLPVSEPLFPVAYSGLVHGCVKNDGHWLSSHKECEMVKPSWCEEVGGNFEPCASACRHQADPTAPCTLQCVPLCRFGEISAPLSTLTPGDATFLIEDHPIRFQDGYAIGELVQAPAGRGKSQARVWGISPPGDLNDDRWPDVGLVIVDDRGALGQYYYLAAATGAPELYVGSNALPVGKGIVPGEIAIEDGQLIFKYSDRFPWESADAPATVGKSKVAEVVDGELVELERPQLDEETARQLAVNTWGDCQDVDCDTLTVRVLDGQDGVWYLEATHEGMKDDSVAAARRTASAHYASGRWLVGAVLRSEFRCQPRRGHQEFSEELCI